jgi:CheY-like chemotaxis protein
MSTKTNSALKTEISYNWNNKKILLVEDDKVNISLIKEILSETGLTMDIAEDGVEAIEKFDACNQYDLILLDIKLPLLDGFKVNQHIRKNNKDILVIAETAFALKDDIKHFKEAGFNDYIIKPFVAEELLTMLSKHLKTSH